MPSKICSRRHFIYLFIYFLIFQRKQVLIFHVNHLPSRRFTWNIKTCFLWKLKKTKQKKNIFQNVVWCSCDWRLVTLSVRLILRVCILRVYYNGKDFAPFFRRNLICRHNKKKKKQKKKTPIQIYRKFHLKKTWKFSDKISDIFHISAQNIDCTR